MKYSSVFVLATALASLVVSAAGLKCYSCMGYDSSLADDPKTNNKNCDVGSFDSSDLQTADMSGKVFCYTISSSATQVNNGDPFTVRGVAKRNDSQILNSMVDGKLRENRVTLVICDADLCNSAGQLASQGLLAALLLPALLYKLLG